MLEILDGTHHIPADIIKFVERWLTTTYFIYKDRQYK